jgi:23S rRNA pseudoU1915 N3-methylase RlmH
LIEAAGINRQHHNNSYFVSIRQCAKEAQGLENELKDLKLDAKHFAFIVDGPQGFHSSAHEGMLGAAVSDLTEWLCDGQTPDEHREDMPSVEPKDL